MPFQLTDLKTKEFWKLTGFFVIVFAFGVLGRCIYKSSWRGSDIAFALVDALMIAGLLGFGFEVFSTKILIEKVADNLTDKLVGQGLPKPLQAHIRAITRTDIVRENYEKTYSFSDLHNGEVMLDIQITFDAKNFSDSPVLYPPTFQEEAVYKPEVVYLEYGLVGEVSKVFNPEDCLGMTTPDALTEVVNCEASGLKLRPFRQGGAICKVRWRYRVTMPEVYSDLTSFSQATTGATLVLDKLPPTLDFRSSGESLQHAEGSRTWYFDRPFIKNQNVRAWWFKRSGE